MKLFLFVIEEENNNLIKQPGYWIQFGVTYCPYDTVPVYKRLVVMSEYNEAAVV